MLIQESDQAETNEKDLKVVTKEKPTEEQMANLLFAWKVIKYVKSNAILLAKNQATVGVGAGQMSRVDAAEIAIRKAGKRAKGAVLASDAFFPFADSIEAAHKAGIEVIIQPGGSIRDEEVIAKADEYGMTMIFTNKRAFKH